MKVKRLDGKVFEIETVSYGRGEWAINLLSVDGDFVNDMGDPDYPTEAAARKAFRASVDRYKIVRGYGWCVV